MNLFKFCFLNVTVFVRCFLICYCNPHILDRNLNTEIFFLRKNLFVPNFLLLGTKLYGFLPMKKKSASTPILSKSDVRK